MHSTAETSALLELATSTAAGAGRLLLERFGRPAQGVDTKTTPTDLVSDADRDAEELIRRALFAVRPHDGVVAEESARGARGDAGRSDVTWVVDPLDGTVNFLFGIPVWCVSIAVTDREGAVVGVVHDPNRNETFTAVRGNGSRLNGRRISVTSRSELSRALIGTGFAYDAAARRVQARTLTRVLPAVRDIRRAGSAALDLAALACGRLDGFYEAPMERWDRAAGELIVREAGGIVTELEAPLGLSPGLVAAGSALHESLRALVLG